MDGYPLVSGCQSLGRNCLSVDSGQESIQCVKNPIPERPPPGGFASVKCCQQCLAVHADLTGVSQALCLASGQTRIVQASGVTIQPLLRTVGPQPSAGD